MLPQDPNVLLSYVNTRLRDEYSSLDDLCESMDASPAGLTEKLAAEGYVYNAEINQFKPI